ADLTASLDLQPEPPPEGVVIGVNGIDHLDRDRTPGPRPAEEHLAHPARPKATGQDVVPDPLRVSWPEGIHATRHHKGMAGAVAPPEPDDPRNRSPEKDLPIAPGNYGPHSCPAPSLPDDGAMTGDERW